MFRGSSRGLSSAASPAVPRLHLLRLRQAARPPVGPRRCRNRPHRCRPHRSAMGSLGSPLPLYQGGSLS
eukprot:8455969-Pyramimonas_sp.AAC.1